MPLNRTAIVTGASGGIGSSLVEAFVKEGYNVVATSLNTRKSLAASPSLVLVDGDIGKQETAAKVVEAAIEHFGTIDVLVNNAGILAPSLSRILRPRISMPWCRSTCWGSSISLS
jgi:NAD(P)-dependent dehydrogenase (short-subunit alcohol dehydrogenase family)